VSGIGEQTFPANPATAALELVTQKIFAMKRGKYARMKHSISWPGPGLPTFIAK